MQKLFWCYFCYDRHMIAFSQKYTVAKLLEPMNEGDEYTVPDWPLHVTLADVFAIDWSEEELITNYTNEFSKYRSVRTSADNDDWFGKNKQVQVTLLTMNKDLINLHTNVINFLKKGNVRFNAPHVTEKGFKAHATVQSNMRLNKGDTVTIDSLTIIDMFPNNDAYRRKVLKTVQFIS